MEKITEEKQNTPDLSQLMTEGRPVFGGTTPGTGDAEPVEKPALPGPDAKKEEEPVPGEEPGAAEGKEDGEKAALPPKEDMPPEHATRFKTHDEAEKGYKELQGKTTKAEQRAADLERENQALKEERDRDKAEKEQKETQAAARTKVVEYGKGRKKQALEAIDQLDPDDPDYRDKAAELLTQADLDIYENYRENQQTPPAEKPATEKTAGAAPTVTKATPADEPGPDEKTAARDHILSRVKEAGIPEDDEFFWLIAGQAPTADDKGESLEFDRQIDWALGKTKDYHSRQKANNQAEIEKIAGEKGRKTQEEGLPLGRGGSPSGPGPAEQDGKKTEGEKAFGLNDAMDFALSTRKLE